MISGSKSMSITDSQIARHNTSYHSTWIFMALFIPIFIKLPITQFSSVQSLSRVRLFATPWIAARQASLSITNSRSSPKLMCIQSVMPSAISSSVVPFSSCPQSLPASGSFPMSQLIAQKAMALHSSTLAWQIPWTEEPGRLQSMGSLRVRHDWATSLSLFTFMHWTRKWQPTPVFLPGESQGWGSLVGCHLWGRTESDMTEVT